ncbi:hypothetical protein A2U01_0000929 [Trifolium medium]|uniref:Gag-pol polyprotein n=1 Tax=Trifolium medium TaxID=97028 RepID=A0A392LYW3_9FABA|nr:hypothetical protein [Trifolium medium]
MSISRPEDFFVPEHFEDKYTAPILTKWEKFPEAIVISGGGYNKVTIGSVKRKFEELIDASSNTNATLDKTKGGSLPLAFYKEELPGGSANAQILLLVRADMANFEVRRVLVDPGSSVDIMCAHLFKTLQLDEHHLTPYVGSDLQGFNGATTKPWGYVDLIVTFGINETAKSIKVQFLVVECPSLYQCILGRTAIPDLLAVPSTAHLKMKYYTNKGKVATLHGDIEAVRRCFEAATKGHNYIDKAPSSSKRPKPTLQLPAPNVSSIDLDNRYSKKENKEEKKLRKENKESDEANKEIPRPIPDGEFELVLLGEDPSKGVKIAT